MMDLPDWQKLVRLIGEDQAAALSAVYGGGRMYVPKLVGAHHPIAEAVGAKDAARLVGEFGGGHVDIPMSLGKRAQVVQLLEADRKVAEICRRVGVSRRHVFYVKAEMRAASGDDAEDGLGDDDQADLFRDV